MSEQSGLVISDTRCTMTSDRGLYACVITSAIWAVLRLMIAHTGPSA